MYMLVVLSIVGSTLNGSQIIDNRMSLTSCNAAIEKFASDKGYTTNYLYKSNAKGAQLDKGSYSIYAVCAEVK